VTLKSHLLLKQNVDSLLAKRRLKRRDLAQYCHRTESWLSQIFTNPERNVPLKYLDRFASFFGLETYQLFQPGIGDSSERRKGLDRRTGKDRRTSALNHQVRESVSSLIAGMTAEDVADLIRLRSLGHDSRDTLRDEAQRLARSEQQTASPGPRYRAAGKVVEHPKARKETPP
jgi:transcriptional regulator with XRE-family HTH domain